MVGLFLWRCRILLCVPLPIGFSYVLPFSQKDMLPFVWRWGWRSTLDQYWLIILYWANKNLHLGGLIMKVAYSLYLQSHQHAR